MPNSEPHILVVDDEKDICENLRDILEDFGYRVDVAWSGDAALRLLEQKSYDVALLDLKMPGIDGVELFRRIRDRRSSTVGMILTAYASPQAASEASRVGAWRVFSKPIDSFELMRQIDSVLHQPLVLVVDDDRDLCDSLRDTFRDQGYRVDIAHSPADAEQRLSESAPHVVLIDLKLADWNGLDVFDVVRARAPDARSILITAYRDEMASSVDDALERGAVAVYYKPFEPARLLAQIRDSLPLVGEDRTV